MRSTLHGEEVPEASRTDYLYFVGSGEFGPKLDEELIGTKPGDILKVNDALPERFGELGGTEVSIQVLVKDVKARKLPEADDEFAKTASEFDTLTQLRDDLRERLVGDEGARGRGRDPRPRAAGHDRHGDRRAAGFARSTRRPSTASRTPGSGPSGPG